MSVNLAKNSASEICEVLEANKGEIVGVVAIAFTRDGFMSWGLHGMIVPEGMAVALNEIHDLVAKLNSLWGMPVEGHA